MHLSLLSLRIIRFQRHRAFFPLFIARDIILTCSCIDFALFCYPVQCHHIFFHDNIGNINALLSIVHLRLIIGTADLQFIHRDHFFARSCFSKVTLPHISAYEIIFNKSKRTDRFPFPGFHLIRGTVCKIHHLNRLRSVQFSVRLVRQQMTVRRRHILSLFQTGRKLFL